MPCKNPVFVIHFCTSSVSHLTLTTSQMDNQEPPRADEDTRLTEPLEENPETPHTPMLKETECASGDFEFHVGK